MSLESTTVQTIATASTITPEELGKLLFNPKPEFQNSGATRYFDSYVRPREDERERVPLMANGHSLYPPEALIEVGRLITNTEAGWRGEKNQEIAENYPQDKITPGTMIDRLSTEAEVLKTKNLEGSSRRVELLTGLASAIRESARQDAINKTL